MSGPCLKFDIFIRLLVHRVDLYQEKIVEIWLNYAKILLIKNDMNYLI